MNETIERATSLYAKGFITKDELSSIIAKEYAKLWARGKILSILNKV
jgi:hypothetical protein